MNHSVSLRNPSFRTLLLFSTAVSVLCGSLPAQAAEVFADTFQLAADAGALDLDRCQVLLDGEEVEIKKTDLLSLLGLSRELRSLSIEHQTAERVQTYSAEYLLVFKQLVPAGTLEVGFAGGETGIRYLAADSDNAQNKIDAQAARNWPSIPAKGLFPPKTLLKALLITNVTDRRKSEFQNCLILRQRLISFTPQAVGSGEQAPFATDPDSLPQGKPWRNTGVDKSPGAVQRLQRGAVSTALPSWYVLSWDEAQSLTGVVLESNAEKFQLYSYVGDPRANPALAGPKDWKRLPFRQRMQVQLTSGDRLIRRWLELQPVQTAAIKLEMTDCGGTPIAAIDRFDVVRSLGDGAAPSSIPNAPSPFAIQYDQPFAGQMAMVIEDAQGRRIRNLVAQVQRTPGEQIEGWDLKDDAGVTVPPGEYRFKVLTAPPLELKYALTAIPTGPTLAPGRTPWQRGESDPDGWLADHSTHTSGIACGDKIYFGAPVVESGVAFIECDSEGRKLWAKHNFAGFTGLKRLASDGQSVYLHERDFLKRLDPATHEITELATLVSPTRKGELTSLAAHDGKVYLSFHGQVPMLDNATLASVVDLDNCSPKYPQDIPDILGNRRVDPNPRMDFLRLLRLTGTPAGQPGHFRADKRTPHFPIYLESSSGSGRYAYICVAFNQPVPLGSVVFPCPDEMKVELFALKANAKYPPEFKSAKDWIPFPTQPSPGWECIAAPENTLTRAVLVRFMNGEAEEEGTDVLDLLANKDDKPSLPDSLGDLKPADDLLGESRKSDWFARLEGMKLLRRRFKNLSAAATVKVNSGEINKQGEWDAQRTTPITPEEPGIYVMEWKSPQQIAGLAIKEIDGAKTAIDVWTGPADAEIVLAGDDNWREVAIYEQARRDSYEPSFNRNSDARYIDGYIDFHENISTQAVRLRVMEQWPDLNDRGTATLRSDRGGKVVDARRCHIYGVSALQYLGGEAPVDTGVHQRIEVRDGQTGELVRDLAGEVDGGLAFTAEGKLFGLRAGRIVKVDTKTGAAEDFFQLQGKEKATKLAIDRDGFFYVASQPSNVIEVFNPEGTSVRTIGKPGGQQLGHWDPERFLSIADMFVTADKSLWIVEGQNLPRRIVHYKTDGTLVKELIGNTPYGGAGVLSRYDNTRLFQGGVEYKIDWKQGTTRIKSLLGRGMPDDVLPVQVDGRLYLTSAPFSHQPTQPVASVYLLDDSTGKARLAAAFGEANFFDPLKQGSLLALLAQGKSLKDYRFLWSDTNGDGEVNAEEVKFELKATTQNLAFGRFDDQLGCQAGEHRYEVSKYLPDGTPVYEKQVTDAIGTYKLKSGNVLGQRMPSSLRNDEGKSMRETQVHRPDGSKAWGYATEHEGVSGLWVPPWEPGYVTNEFGVIGHETANGGDLGEFFVVHANNGQWKVWSADGLLAGNFMYHLGDPRSRTIRAYETAQPGMKFDHLTAGQEHFHGHFTKHEVDGRYYAVFGHNYISIMEVTGLDQFKRIEGTINVSSDDVRRVRAWEAERARRVVKSKAKLLRAFAMTGEEVPLTAEMDQAEFGMAFDAQALYLRWRVQHLGPLKNSGKDFQRYFKTGAAVDFQISTDPEADPGRRRAVQGDLRLLTTLIDGNPQVVLYQAVAPNASEGDAWETRTEAGGVTSFDRVVLLKQARVSLNLPEDGQGNYYDITVAVPLDEIGLKIKEGLQLKMDWGVLTTETGDAVRRRIYWSNQLANGTADEALEARLEPQLWGAVQFRSETLDEQRLTDLVPDVSGNKKSTKQASDLLKEIEDDLK